MALLVGDENYLASSIAAYKGYSILYPVNTDRSWSQGQVLSGHSFKENLITIAQMICLSEFLTSEIHFSDTFQVNINQRCNNK